jgi:probable O-glycosylation ligase (exosortase A-associated)
MILFLMKNGRIFPQNVWTKLGYSGLIVLSLAAAIGTHERTALVGMFVLGVAISIFTKRKVLFGTVCVVAGLVIASVAPASWTERMSTIDSSSDESINVRLEVWKWTLNYVKQHPQGGGFEAYRINTIFVPIRAEDAQADDAPLGYKRQTGRAFHSSYFEVLGEHGWLGLALFLGLILSTYFNLRQAKRQCRNVPQLSWAFDLSFALLSSLSVLLACSAFIGIAFQPFFYYVFAIALSLREYVFRVRNVAEPSPAGLERLAPALS